VRSPRSRASICVISSADRLEVEDVDVLVQPLDRDRLREHHDPELDVPAQHHLRGRLAVGLGDRDDRRVVEDQALRDRAPGLGDDAAVRVLAAQAGLLQVGVR
jgi:hypothetical protein